MNINIWSDVRCPFCYIGKRKFEMALEMFPHKDKVNVSWQSFELDPNLETRTDVNAIDYISNVKGISREDAEGMHLHVTQVAKEVGLDFNFDKAILANSLNAHRLMHLAKISQLSGELKEVLFRAYFTDGKDLNDLETLKTLALEVGLKKVEIEDVLNSNQYEEEVLKDQKEADAIGINGVPFFIFDYKYAVSGAQSVETFLRTIEKAWIEGDFDAKSNMIETIENDNLTKHG